MLYEKVLNGTGLAVVAEPATYGESFRLYEHFAYGHVMLHEPLETPVADPFVRHEHYFVYDIRDRDNGAADMKARVRWILEHPEIAQAVARQGWVHAKRYHTSVTRLDYVVRTLATLFRGKNYTKTGVDLVANWTYGEPWEKEYAKGKDAWNAANGAKKADEMNKLLKPYYFDIPGVDSSRIYPEPAVAMTLGLPTTKPLSLLEPKLSQVQLQMLMLRGRNLLNSVSERVAEAEIAEAERVDLRLAVKTSFGEWNTG